MKKYPGLYRSNYLKPALLLVAAGFFAIAAIANSNAPKPKPIITGADQSRPVFFVLKRQTGGAAGEPYYHCW